MQIAICDDEQIFRVELRKFLVAYKTERRIQMDIYEFSDGKALLGSNVIFDMVFLDYQMPDLDGMDTARVLRSKNVICSIVFVTNYPGFVLESFEVSPYRFFPKPIETEKLYNMLDMYIRQQKALAPIIINDFDGQKTIPAKDIVFIEGDGKYCRLHTTSEVVHCSKTIAAVLKLLPQYCFFRTHKSFAINMYFVAKVENDTIFMINEETAYVSRKYAPSFKKTYREFVKNYYVRM